MKPIYIFDLDGTLALIEHRRHFVEDETKDWRAFFAACVDDSPNGPVVQTLAMLFESGCEIWVWSGRSDEVRRETEEWFQRHRIAGAISQFRMRAAGDHQPDEKLKAAWLTELTKAQRRNIVAVFEDRDRMVALWRSQGLACFQVAPGAF